MPVRPRPDLLRSPRLPAAGAVCALHLLLALLWPGRPSGRPDAGQAQVPLQVQLLASPVHRPAAPPARPLAIQTGAPQAPRWAAPDLQRPTAPVADPTPAKADTPPGVEPTDPARSAGGTGPGSPPMLRLDLPPSPLRSPSGPSPLAAPRPRSVESRLAQGLTSTPLREEAMGNGRVRLRQGDRCVDLRDARMAQIDPFNRSGHPIPKQAEDCAR